MRIIIETKGIDNDTFIELYSHIKSLCKLLQGDNDLISISKED